MFMRAYSIGASLALAFFATAAFRQPSLRLAARPEPVEGRAARSGQATPQNLGEITVERITVVDKDGTLRMVIPDKAAAIALADGNGPPRLTLTVDAAGNPRIESLDENGKVVQRWP